MRGLPRAAHSTQGKRDVFLLEISRGRTIPQALRTVRWSPDAYWSQRHRHRDWADEVDYAMQTRWRSGACGRAGKLDGRSLRGALKRWTFLEGVRGGKTPSHVRREMNWSGPAYWQARYRHPEWAAHIDALIGT